MNNQLQTLAERPCILSRHCCSELFAFRVFFEFLENGQVTENTGKNRVTCNSDCFLFMEKLEVSVVAVDVEGVASVQPRRVLAVRALSAPWVSASLVFYRSSRDKLSG